MMRFGLLYSNLNVFWVSVKKSIVSSGGGFKKSSMLIEKKGVAFAKVKN